MSTKQGRDGKGNEQGRNHISHHPMMGEGYIPRHYPCKNQRNRDYRVKLPETAFIRPNISSKLPTKNQSLVISGDYSLSSNSVSLLHSNISCYEHFKDNRKVASAKYRHLYAILLSTLTHN